MPQHNLLPKQAPALHGGHLALVAFCAAALIALATMKNGFSIPEVFSTSVQVQAPVKITYEDMRHQVLAERGSVDTIIQQKNQNQIALLDPTFGQARVLGAQTDQSPFPHAESIFTPELLSKITIKHSADTSPEAVESYVQQLLLAETNLHSLDIIASINSSDPKSQTFAQSQAKLLVAAFAQIPVPAGLEEYHRLKMVYYTIAAHLGDALGTGKGEQVEGNSMLFFSLTDRIERLRQEASVRYHVEL